MGLFWKSVQVIVNMVKEMSYWLLEKFYIVVINDMLLTCRIFTKHIVVFVFFPNVTNIQGKKSYASIFFIIIRQHFIYFLQFAYHYTQMF